jgi:hypothetical protein
MMMMMMMTTTNGRVTSERQIEITWKKEVRAETS